MAYNWERREHLIYCYHRPSILDAVLSKCMWTDKLEFGWSWLLVISEWYFIVPLCICIKLGNVFLWVVLQQYMDSEIRAIMAQYMPLDSQAEVPNHVNDERAWEGEFGNLFVDIMDEAFPISFMSPFRILCMESYIVALAVPYMDTRVSTRWSLLHFFFCSCWECKPL